ncbi:four helix bundle protein [Bacteroidales bacterium OttesenSCG-928-J19]|nr:four helix bundle protein [Bacteroidales bacterium OttesenSCG-928-J19]
MKKSIAYEKAYCFSIAIIKTYNLLLDTKEYVLSKQLLRAGTSIGANIAEANGAISEAEFSAKISIAYKETLETQYWISLLKDTGFIPNELFIQLNNDVEEIAKILFSILKTTRIKKNS